MIRRTIQLVVAVSAVLIVAAVPAAANGSASSPSFVGGVADDAFGGHIWFDYAVGREARHITAGTYEVEIDDQSSTHNFHLRDITWGGTQTNEQTDPIFVGSVTWAVTFATQGSETADYEILSDDDPAHMHEVITVHPPVAPPPPPPPPPSPAGPPPPPPPPPQPPDMIATVGPEQRIAIFFSDGRRVTRLAPGTYTLQVHDLSTAHNFHLTGPGINQSTPVNEIVHPIWTLTVRAGKYTIKCDVHATMKDSFTVAIGAPPPPTKCRVPRVVGKGLAAAKRAIAAAHCSVGRVRRMRSKRVRGRVVSQSPRAGRTLARRARVNLVVSRGPG